MNILLISGAAGGVGRHIIDLAAFLLIKRNHVTLIYSGERTDSYFIKRLQILESLGCKLERIDFQRKIGPIDFFVSLKIILYILKEPRFDIIHGHSSKGGLYARILWFFSRAKILYSPHAFFTMSPGNHKILHQLIRILECSMSYITFKIIVTSLKEMEHLSFLMIPKDKAKLIPNGSYRSPFKVKHKKYPLLDFPKKDIKLTIGFVGRFCYQKNLDLAIEIFEQCLLIENKIRLILVGSGDDELRIKKLVKQNGLSKKVIFLGDTSIDEVITLFDLLLVTSRYEGSPYLFQDAAKYGIPIVSTNVGGVEFFVKNKKSGYIFSSSAEAAKLILNLANSSDLIKNFSRESIKIAKYYSWERMGNEIIKLYKSSKEVTL